MSKDLTIEKTEKIADRVAEFCKKNKDIELIREMLEKLDESILKDFAKQTISDELLDLAIAIDNAVYESLNCKYKKILPLEIIKKSLIFRNVSPYIYVYSNALWAYHEAKDLEGAVKFLEKYEDEIPYMIYKQCKAFPEFTFFFKDKRFIKIYNKIGERLEKIRDEKKIKLSKILEPYRDQIQDSIKPHIEISRNKKVEAKLWESKYGGNPYMPKDFEYPKIIKSGEKQEDQPLMFLAQINFGDFEKFENFPDKGLIQFYVDGNDPGYGYSYEDDSKKDVKQERYRVLYFEDVIENEDELIADFSFLPKFKYPFDEKNKLGAMKFERSQAPVPADDAGDYRFLKYFTPGFDLDDKASDKYWDLRNNEDKIGGYATFEQSDPRRYKDTHKKYDPYKEYILLFHMNYWGTFNFFIAKDDLEKKDFSKVIIHGDSD